MINRYTLAHAISLLLGVLLFTQCIQAVELRKEQGTHRKTISAPSFTVHAALPIEEEVKALTPEATIDGKKVQ